MATVITTDNVKARYPGLMDYDNTESIALLELAIEDADLDIDEDKWLGFFTRGMCALAAHFASGRLAAGEQGAGTGPFAVSGASADGVSVSYSVPSDIAPELALFYSTTYGQEYLELMKRLFSGPHIVQP